MKTTKFIFTTVMGSLILILIIFYGCKKDPVLATLTTGDISSITENSATGSGDISNDGGSSITSRGICWGTTPDPTVAGSFINASTASVGSFNCNIAPLVPNTAYYVRAFAINEVGVAYGNSVTFTSLEAESGENLPTLSTSEVIGVTSNSATCGGVIYSDGGTTVINRGVCWSTNSTPTVSDSKTTDGAGAGTFTSNITGLDQGTTYYVRAYATNADGSGYGSTMSFTTESLQLPTVTTSSITEITFNTAKSGGNVTDDGYSEITSRGICWSTSHNPTISDSKTVNGLGEGSFFSEMEGLNPSTVYYVRAYAINSIGVGYGVEVAFTTSDLSIGDSFQGGLVAYIFEEGDLGYIEGEIHGLIIATTNQGNAEWGCYNVLVEGAMGIAIGSGQQNTTDILSGCSESGIAAKICSDYASGGYTDWFLPSRIELSWIYHHCYGIIDLSSSYWSSTQDDAQRAVLVFGGDSGSVNKNQIESVRAVRYF